jgi:polar amino acid transport system substrate-binding protein
MGAPLLPCLAAVATLWGTVAAAADVPARPRLVVGVNPDYPPFEYRDREGNAAGFNTDLTLAIAEVMGLDVEFRFAPWAELRAGLLDGEIDALQGITFSSARAAALDFAPAHAYVQHAIFARRGTLPVSGFAGLAGKEVIVFRGGIMEELLEQQGGLRRLIRSDTPADALRLLASGQGDYAVVALLPGLHLSHELGLTNVVPVDRAVHLEKYGFAVRKGNEAALARIEQGLAILKQTGRYVAIQERWLGVLEPDRLHWRAVARTAATVLAMVLVLLGATVLWTAQLRRKVAQRTSALQREVAERNRALQEMERQHRQLVQAERMAALGALVAGVGDEVKRAVGAVETHLPGLRAAFPARADGPSLAEPPPAPPDGALHVEAVASGVARIQQIVDGLEDFARRDEGAPQEPLDVNEIARAAARLAGAALQRATRRFDLVLAPGLPAVVGNARRLQQVLVNLLLNACEALPDVEGLIRLETRHGPIGRSVVIEVGDEGVGIPPEQLPRLCDPFFTTKRGGGIGLGLAVAQRIVAEHRGKLELASAVGVGTTATVTLPASAVGAAGGVAGVA